MNRTEISQIQGQLINAVSGGGEAALWNIARGSGRKARAASDAIELATSPHHNLDIETAITLVCRYLEGGEPK